MSQDIDGRVGSDWNEIIVPVEKGSKRIGTHRKEDVIDPSPSKLPTSKSSSRLLEERTLPVCQDCCSDTNVSLT